jgi:hypothetical protein
MVRPRPGLEFVADVACFIGEGSLRYVPAKQHLRPALPIGYDYDGINAEILHTRADVVEGLLRLSTGPRYRCLVLSAPQCATLTTAMLVKLHELVGQGLVLVGAR